MSPEVVFKLFPSKRDIVETCFLFQFFSRLYHMFMYGFFITFVCDIYIFSQTTAPNVSKLGRILLERMALNCLGHLDQTASVGQCLACWPRVW